MVLSRSTFTSLNFEEMLRKMEIVRKRETLRKMKKWDALQDALKEDAERRNVEMRNFEKS